MPVEKSKENISKIFFRSKTMLFKQKMLKIHKFTLFHKKKMSKPSALPKPKPLKRSDG